MKTWKYQKLIFSEPLIDRISEGENVNSSNEWSFNIEYLPAL